MSFRVDISIHERNAAKQISILRGNKHISKYITKIEVIIPGMATSADLEAWMKWDRNNEIPTIHSLFLHIPALVDYLRDFNFPTELKIMVECYSSNYLFTICPANFEWLLPLYDL